MTMFSVPFYHVLVFWRLWTLSYGVISAENKLSVTKVNPLQITKRNEVISRKIPPGGTPLQEPNGDVPLDGVAFHNWSDYYGVAFLIQLLEWGRKFSNFGGK